MSCLACPVCVFVYVFNCVSIHAFLQCECFHKHRREVKCLFEHMLDSLLRAILSATIPSASGNALGAVQLSLSFHPSFKLSTSLSRSILPSVRQNQTPSILMQITLKAHLFLTPTRGCQGLNLSFSQFFLKCR